MVIGYNIAKGILRRGGILVIRSSDYSVDDMRNLAKYAEENGGHLIVKDASSEDTDLLKELSRPHTGSMSNKVLIEAQKNTQEYLKILDDCDDPAEAVRRLMSKKEDFRK